MRTLFSFVAFGLSVGIFFMYTQPTYDGFQSVQATIAQYDQALSRATELQKLRETLFSRYNSFNKSDVDRLHKLLPDHVDNVRLVLDFDSMATRHQMAIQNVAINSKSADSDKAPTIGGAPSTQKYESINLRFSTDGTYSDFVSFLDELERSLRIVDVVALNIAQGQVLVGEPTYHYDVTIRTYWLR